MTKQSPAKAPPPEIGKIVDLIPRLMLFPGEDPIAYEDLRDALLGDLAPGAPYERALAENLVTLEWEAIRHRRMRDTLIKAKARELAIGVYSTGEATVAFRPDEAAGRGAPRARRDHRRIHLGNREPRQHRVRLGAVRAP